MFIDSAIGPPLFFLPALIGVRNAVLNVRFTSAARFPPASADTLPRAVMHSPRDHLVARRTLLGDD
jgi:hypothetical protein